MQVWLHSISTREVDDLVSALGAARCITRSEASPDCADLDEEVTALRAGRRARPRSLARS